MEQHFNQALSRVDCFFLDSFFKKDKNNEQILNLTKVHGFISAIISSPTIVKPTEWTRVILGPEPEFESAAQAEKIMDLILDLYKQISRQLRGVEHFSLLLWEEGKTHEISGCSIHLLKDWCDGYLEGVKLDPLWETDRYALSMLTPFYLFAKKQKIDDWAKTFSSEELRHQESCLLGYRQHLVDFIEDNYAYWLNEREEVINFYNKQKENDIICSCGSKLAFDKCSCAALSIRH